MDHRPSGELTAEINSLAHLDFSEQTLDDTLRQVGSSALKDLPGWDAAATTIVERRKVVTFGATDELVVPVDQSQYDLEEGPCLQAVMDGETHYFTSSSSNQRWPRFAKAADQAGIHSVFSLPLRTKDHVFGALNLYSRQHDALQEGQKETGLLFAAQASVMLGNAKAFHSQAQIIEQLEEGLQTRTMIGQAVGLLMAQEGMTSEEAFQRLVSVSQNANIKLREIAKRYVEAFENKHGNGTKTE